MMLNSSKLKETRGEYATAVFGHTWGDLNDDVALKYPQGFTRVVAADTLWMDWEHENLAKSIMHFLSDDLGARAIVVAGFHTGRPKMAKFWDVAVAQGFLIESITERDVDGVERDFLKDRGIEDVVDRKRWLVIGILKKRVSSAAKVDRFLS